MGKTKSGGTPRSSVGRITKQYLAAGVIAPLSPSIKQSKIKDSARAKLVRYAIESVGSRVTGDPVRRGHDALIPCDADSRVEGLLRKRLMATGFRNGIRLHRVGDHLWIQFLDRSARVGRPVDSDTRNAPKS
jgi:hypothetical protein